MAYATHDDVQARYEQDLDARLEALVDTRLGDAELLLLDLVPDLAGRIADEVLYPNYEQKVILAEAEMVLRLIRNPEGYSQESDGNYSYAIYQAVASGKLEITDYERGLLGEKVGMRILAPTLVEDPEIPFFDPATAWQYNISGQHWLTRGYYP